MEFKIDQLLNAAAAYQLKARQLEIVNSNSVVTVGVPGSESRSFVLENDSLTEVKACVSDRLKVEMNSIMEDIKSMTDAASPFQ